MVEYSSCGFYVTSASTTQDRITRINAIIDMLLTSALTSAGTSGTSEYWLDDGQVKIKEVFRSTDAVLNAIQSFEKLKQMYINDLNNASMVRLVDSKNFRRRC